MFTPAPEDMSSVCAADLAMGDDIVNVGVVNMPPEVSGVRVMVETYALRYMPVSGRIERPLETHVYHMADVLVVVRAMETY